MVPEETLLRLIIYQPRDRNNPNPVRLWTLTRCELRHFCHDIDQKARSIIADPDHGDFIPNPEHQCRFCPAQGICRAYAAHALGVVLPVETLSVGTEVELPNPQTLTREQRIKALSMKEGLELWLNAVEKQEIADLTAGAPRQGYKLVEGKANRVWSDEAKAAELLAKVLKPEQIRPPSDIITPAQAEKLTKKTEISEPLAALITKPQGKPTLVPESDKREALCFDPNKKLENIDLI